MLKKLTNETPAAIVPQRFSVRTALAPYSLTPYMALLLAVASIMMVGRTALQLTVIGQVSSSQVAGSGTFGFLIADVVALMSFLMAGRSLVTQRTFGGLVAFLLSGWVLLISLLSILSYA
jgi:hypothetical protein